MNSYHSKFKNEYNKHSKTDSNYSISLNQLDQPLDVSNNMNVMMNLMLYIMKFFTIF